MTVLYGLIHDHSFHFAAGTAFRVTLAIFPLLVALITIASFTGSADRMGEVLQAAGRTDAVPQRTIESLQGQLDELREPGSNVLLGGLAALAFALWSSAGAFRTTMTGLNRAFKIHDQAGLVPRFFISLGLAIVTATLAAGATLLVAEGPIVEEFVESLPGGAGPLDAFWDAVRFPIIALLVFGWLSITYAFGPADRRRFKLVSPGIILAFLLWMVFALVFSWYVDSVGKSDDTYGAFAGLIVFQLYVYWSALIVFIGAHVDNALGERGHETDTGGD